MAIAHDAQTIGTAYTSTGTQNTSHAASASARAAVVMIHQNTTADWGEVSGVTYGGVAMERLAVYTEWSEAQTIYIYFLDHILTGTQTVAMTTTASNNKQLVVATMTVTSGRSVTYNTGVDFDALVSKGDAANGAYANAANPALDLTGLTNGVVYAAYEVIASGLTTMTATPSNSFTLISSTDLGATGRGFARRVFTASGTTQAAGWTAATSDDYVIAGIAFTEGPWATTVELWESGSFVASLGETVAGTVGTFDITPHITSLADQSGAGVELKLSSAGAVNIEAIQWDAWTTVSGPTTWTADANLSVTPATAASAAAISRSQSAAGVTVAPVVLSAGVRAALRSVATAVSPLSAAAGVSYQSMFWKPDALLSMSGLSGTVADIQDSPTAPGGTGLVPTGGAIDVRMSFENPGNNLRTQTGDQIIRILMSVP